MDPKTSKTKSKLSFLAVAAFATTTMVAGSAFAFGGPWGGGHGRRGKGRHHRGMKGLRCAKMLMHAPPDRLKEKLKLSDAQISKLEPLRMNFLTKKIKGKAEVQLNRLKMRRLMQADLPDQNKVLKLMRKQRNIRGRIHEEGLKAYISALKIMSAEQRKDFRVKCRKMGKGRHFKRFGRGGFGRGKFGPGGGFGRGRGHGPRGGGGQ